MEAAKNYYMCFQISTLPDLTLAKYSVFDGSSVADVMEKHGTFLRQLHRLGFGSGVYFHLLYYYSTDQYLSKGEHLKIYFYATSKRKEKLQGIREFLVNSVLSTYYDFRCFEITDKFDFELQECLDSDAVPVIVMENISGEEKRYGLNGVTNQKGIEQKREEIASHKRNHVVCEIASDANALLSLDGEKAESNGRIVVDASFSCRAFLTKKSYTIPAQNRLPSDLAGDVMLYSILDWEPCENGRLYNVLKLMEGYDRNAALRIDIFPVEKTSAIRGRLPYPEIRRRIADRQQGKDDNSETVVKSWDKYLQNLMKFPQFVANIVAFSDSPDIAVMLADSVGAEAVESGAYEVVSEEAVDALYNVYSDDTTILCADHGDENYVADFLSLYTLEEIRPMFSFPILYPGESVECQKETDPVRLSNEAWVDEKKTMHEAIQLGMSELGYPVFFPVKLFKKHAFIAGVPGAGKTNTMLHIVTSLWRDTEQKVPFLVLEPAKQEYRALLRLEGMRDVTLFSPGADTKFPLHINPFQFPKGLTLAEHIANLNAVFAGAFELPPPSPHFIDTCIEKVYIEKGWNINERNMGVKPYPSLQDLYDSLVIAVNDSHYQGETLGNLRSVLEVRVGSLLKREIGNVYNVESSSIEPEDWLDRPVIIELEPLGEGPANFMSLLISTLVREALKVRKLSGNSAEMLEKGFRREINHIIFYEEAHNLIGPDTNSPLGDSVDPKISATKYLVKMLAEVRALNEGIVIADQLPTVMAAEVLKNTGLKIGHRITAQDDRSLLGSTMSASADQLEEQGIFKTGYALIFYEDLQKPYKMRVSEWEKGGDKNRYESPSDEELFQLLHENPNYRNQLSRSAAIINKKLRREFALQRLELQKLKEKSDKSKSDNENDQYLIERQTEMLKTLEDVETIRGTRLNISRLNEAVKKYQTVTVPDYQRQLKKICYAYVNLYFSYMTLAENYRIPSAEDGRLICDELFVRTINEFLELYVLVNNYSEYSEIIMQETSAAINHMSDYIGIYTDNGEWLREHPLYSEVLLKTNYILADAISVSCLQTERELQRINRLWEVKPENANQRVATLCSDVKEYCRNWYEAAAYHQDNILQLKNVVDEQLSNALMLEEKTYQHYQRLSELIGECNLLIYRQIAEFLITFFATLRKEIAYSALFYNDSKEIRDVLQKLVNYMCRKTEQGKPFRYILSDCRDYGDFCDKAYPALLVSMHEAFNGLQQQIDNLCKGISIGRVPKENRAINIQLEGIAATAADIVSFYACRLVFFKHHAKGYADELLKLFEEYFLSLIDHFKNRGADILRLNQRVFCSVISFYETYYKNKSDANPAHVMMMEKLKKLSTL